MGRHAGWLAAAAGLAGAAPDEAPHLILFPERAYDEADFLAAVKADGRPRRLLRRRRQRGHPRPPTAASSPTPAAARTPSATPSSAASPPFLAGRVKDELGLKVHWTLPDYLQRSARHLASATDLEQAQAVGTRRRRAARSRA